MIAELNVAFAGIRSALDIAKGLRAVDNAAAIASAQLQISELVEKLVDAKDEFMNLSNLVEARDKEIAELKHRLQRSADVIKHLGAYYEKDADGKAIDDPYCSRCFEVDGRLVHLTLPAYQINGSTCPQCRQSFPWERTPPIQ